MRRSKHSLSHYKLFSADMGWLIPCGMIEVLPGDTVQASTHALIRTQPLMAPVMHPVDVRIHHWYVPFRIIWQDFEDFITGGPDGNSIPVVPYFDIASSTSGGLFDYLGVPPGTYSPSLRVTTLPTRAYTMIWNEWYRDQDLQAPLGVATTSGADVGGGATNRQLQRVNWEKDYFTSARPWEQKGPSITIPLGDEAPVVRRSEAGAWDAYQTGTDTLAADLGLGTAGGKVASTGQPSGLSLDPNDGLYADLQNASAVTVNLLREALALQRFEEARARYGSRYTEYLRYLGVRSSDARLQRPEYLGGGRQTIQFSEVLQTAEGTNPVGEMRGHGIGAMRTNRYRRFFEEHGLVLSLMSVRPKTIYMNGVNRFWLKRTKEDFWQKELEHIGQQEVMNAEVYAEHSDPRDTFGYQDRYDEYRRQESGVAGEFRNSLLNFWHMGRDFSAPPALNSSFVSCVPTERTFPVPGQDVLYVMANHRIAARRLVSKRGSSYIF